MFLNITDSVLNSHIFFNTFFNAFLNVKAFPDSFLTLYSIDAIGYFLDLIHLRVSNSGCF